MENSDIFVIFGIVAVLVFLIQQWAQDRKVVTQVVGLTLLIAAVSGYFAYKHREQTRKTQESAARRAEFESRIARFAAKYNAVRDWQKPLLAKGKPVKLYSVELQPLLVRPDGRLILLFASLRNVSEGDGRAVIFLDEATGLESQLKLQLDCTPDQARFAMSTGPPQTFAVIAQIRSVEYAPAGDYSLATGRCLDLKAVSLPDYLEFVVEPELEKQVHHPGG